VVDGDDGDVRRAEREHEEHGDREAGRETQASNRYDREGQATAQQTAGKDAFVERADHECDRHRAHAERPKQQAIGLGADVEDLDRQHGDELHHGRR
jgi:hypothetical protein